MRIITCFTNRARMINEGFTRGELLAVVLSAGILILLGWQAAAGTRSRGGLLLCKNNLRRVGQAFQEWNVDQGERYPWRVPVAEGGTMLGTSVSPMLRSANAWEELAVLRSLVQTPRIFYCPDDRSGREAREFTASTAGGFFNAGYRNNSVSYFLGLDILPGDPPMILAGDRNVRYDVLGTACVTGINTAAGVSRNPSGSLFGWTNAIHGLTGNILLSDGTVGEVTTAELQSIVRRPANDNSSLHFLQPR